MFYIPMHREEDGRNNAVQYMSKERAQMWKLKGYIKENNIKDYMLHIYICFI